MHNLWKAIVVIGVTGLILACSFAAAPVSQTESVSTIVAATLQALTPAAPAATLANQAKPVPGLPVSYANVTFNIPPGIATGAVPQTIPATTDQNGGPWAAAPQHVEFTLTGYGLPPGSFSEILIDVYPAQDYASANSGASISLQRLQGILSNPSGPLTNDMLPQVPYFNAGPMFAAQAKVIKFKDGSGVRMITQYGQAPGPAANNGTFYHFQGLTDDGKYYIVAVLPIQAPFLENGNNPSAPLPAGGIPFPGNNYADPHFLDSYYKAVTDKLNGTASTAFQPPLNSLDALIQSLAISP